MDDYISREMVLRRFEDIKKAAPRLSDKVFLDGVMAVIDNIKAANVEPMVRAEWVLVCKTRGEHDTLIEEKCSLCGRHVERYDTQPEDNYCPNCGAKMGKEDT